MTAITTTPWSYFCIRLFLKLVLKIFYGNIVVENTHLIPRDSESCILCANHDNSITDASVLLTSVPLERRSLLRMTAKSTHFGKKSFVGWLIEATGAVPVKRRVDFPGAPVDNTDTMIKLIEALEDGEIIGFFPEGVSRYSPALAPLKSGVSRIVSQVLSRNRDKPDFEVSILPCSITYMRRQHFRSDILVSFQPPIKFRPKYNPELLEPVDFECICKLTGLIHERIGAGTLHAPSWKTMRSAKTAAQIYAPLGTTISLGDHVRMVKTFLEAFKDAGSHKNVKIPMNTNSSRIMRLEDALEEYQDQLSRWHTKDECIRIPLSLRAILCKMIHSLIWTVLLLTLCLPGVVLWAPVFISTGLGARWYKTTGPMSETEVRIAHTKQLLGFFSLSSVLSIAMACTCFYSPAAAMFVPLVMWVTLRWLEDFMASARIFIAFARLLWIGPAELHRMRLVRESLHHRVMDYAENSLGLPANPARHFADSAVKEMVRTRGSLMSKLHYFSIGARRKKDWNESLRFDEKVDYTEDD
ncbi:hypothetical protein BKA93DRAFT_729131 [Sparassis latifolia]